MFAMWCRAASLHHIVGYSGRELFTSHEQVRLVIATYVKYPIYHDGLYDYHVISTLDVCFLLALFRYTLR